MKELLDVVDHFTFGLLGEFGASVMTEDVLLLRRDECCARLGRPGKLGTSNVLVTRNVEIGADGKDVAAERGL
mgnify:CR=1 FL=1